jgi:nucleoid-associated protein YgaU
VSAGERAEAAAREKKTYRQDVDASTEVLMTRETKVGLIVGLGFIVVFAVILSHKGGQPRAAGTSDLGPLVDASAATGAAADTTRNRSRHSTATGTPRSDARSPGGANAAANGSARPQPGPGESRLERPKSLTGTEAPAATAQPNSGKTRVPLAEMPDKAQADRGSDSLSPSLKTWLEESPKKNDADADRMGATARRTAPPVAAPAPTAAPDAKPVPPTPREASPAPTPPTSAEPAAEPKPRVKQEYIVKKGETLIRIAQSVYGKGTPREVDAIVKANKKEVPDVKRIPVGAKLIIPELPAGQFEAATFPPSKTASNVSEPPVQIALTTPSAGPEPDSKDPKEGGATKTSKDAKAAKDTKPTKEAKDDHATSDKPDKSDKASNWRWYTVQEGETYAGIARKHLGSADRWKEIHELNKGKFRDPLRVPAGAKIKLPSHLGELSKL